MSDSITDLNAVTRGIIDDKEKVIKMFEDIFKPLNIPFSIKERTVLK